jgi:hypothetical protein
MPVANTRTWGRFSPSGPLNWAWGRFCCPKLFDEDGLRLLKAFQCHSECSKET